MSISDGKWQRDAADQNFDYMFKLLIIGNSSVGKTSFLFRYADNSFTSAFVSTVGIDFKVKTVFRQDKRVKLQIWVRDCESFLSLGFHVRETLHLCSFTVNIVIYGWCVMSSLFEHSSAKNSSLKKYEYIFRTLFLISCCVHELNWIESVCSEVAYTAL